MVKVPKLRYRVIKRMEKLNRIKDLNKYAENIQHGVFNKYKYDVERLQNRNFIKKWLNDYYYKRDMVKYKDPSWITVVFDVPEVDKLAYGAAKHFTNKLKMEGKI